MAAALRASGGVAGLCKKMWNEIPEVVASTGLALVGLGMGGAALYIYYAKDGDNKRYKNNFTVYRPDDPRVKFIKD